MKGKKSKIVEKESSVFISSQYENRMINTALIMLFVCIVSLIVGGVMVIYSNMKKEKFEPVVSYEEGIVLNNLVSKLNVLGKNNVLYENYGDNDYWTLVASLTEKDESGNYKVEDLNKVSNKYFGKDANIVTSPVGVKDVLYQYDEVSNTYVKKIEGYGAGPGVNIYSEFFKSEKDGKEYEMTYLEAIAPMADVGCGPVAYYKDSSLKEKLFDLEYNMETCELKTDIEKQISFVKDRLVKHTYVFEKKDDRFILVSDRIN